MSEKLILKGIQESGNIINFNPPLVIDYTIYEKIDKETGKENYTEERPIMAFATFDFGMEIRVALDSNHNCLINGYGGLTEESSLDDKLMYSIFFDLFHAFFHTPQDPNYSYYHWALYGNLKDRVNLTEFD